VRGILNQTDMFYILSDALGLTPASPAEADGEPETTPEPNENPQATPVAMAS
jgi:hypothetical protein